MIVNLHGMLESRGVNDIEITLGGVTVRVAVSTATLGALGPTGSTVRILTHLIVREEELSLYGFATSTERAAFLALQGVSGIGPKLALVVLSLLSPANLAHAVEAEDTDALSQVPGIGKRTAARLIVELKGKLEEFMLGDGASPPGAAPMDDPELTTALQALGFSQIEIRRAFGALGEDSHSLPIEERIRQALQAVSAT
ncbi:MAG: Holliday junction branch migration protein RuvA [Dehalococcoidia bacterium]|jgi:Holliday junction DNA helicase RuvA|nr:Holliday junction branch migration protein RuvA [Dehalococcoidia bacterium]